MDYLNTKQRGKKRAVARRVIGVALLLFVAGALAGCRPVAWILLKRPRRANCRAVDCITTQHLARWLHAQERPAPVLPALPLFNLGGDLVAGTAIPLALFGKAALLGCVYTSVYLFFAWVAFQGKEL